MSEVFISYSRGDSQFVDKLIHDLEQNGIPVWLDRQDIEGGEAWRAAISEAIRRCRAFLIVLSPLSTRSKNVSRELSLAETHDRMIIPIIYQACDIPAGMEYQLTELQWVNLTVMSYEEGLQRVVRVLTTRGKPGSETPALNIEKRHSDTARLRQMLESSTAQVSVATESPVATAQAALPQPAERATEPRPELVAKPSTDGLLGKLTSSKLVIAGLVFVALLGFGGYLLSGDSDSESSSTTPSTATENPEATPLAASPEPEHEPVIGNKDTQIYYHPDCPDYDKVQAEFKVKFKDEEAAEKAGYKLADNCP